MGMKSEMSIFTSRTLPSPGARSEAVSTASSGFTGSCTGNGQRDRSIKTSPSPEMHPQPQQFYTTPSSPPRNNKRRDSQGYTSTSTTMNGPPRDDYPLVDSDTKGNTSYMRSDSYMRMRPDFPDRGTPHQSPPSSMKHYYRSSDGSSSSHQQQQLGRNRSLKESDDQEGEDDDSSHSQQGGGGGSGGRTEEPEPEEFRSKRRLIEKRSRERRGGALDALRMVVAEEKQPMDLMTQSLKRDYQADICYDAASIIKRLRKEKDELSTRLQKIEGENQFLRIQLQRRSGQGDSNMELEDD